MGMMFKRDGGIDNALVESWLYDTYAELHSKLWLKQNGYQSRVTIT